MRRSKTFRLVMEWLVYYAINYQDASNKESHFASGTDADFKSFSFAKSLKTMFLHT